MNIHYLSVSHRMFLLVVVYLLCQPLLHFRVQCQEVGGEGQSTGSGLMASQDQEISIGCDMTNLEAVQFGSSASSCHLFQYTLVLFCIACEVRRNKHIQCVNRLIIQAYCTSLLITTQSLCTYVCSTPYGTYVCMYVKNSA